MIYKKWATNNRPVDNTYSWQCKSCNRIITDAQYMALIADVKCVCGKSNVSKFRPIDNPFGSGEDSDTAAHGNTK